MAPPLLVGVLLAGDDGLGAVGGIDPVGAGHTATGLHALPARILRIGLRTRLDGKRSGVDTMIENPRLKHVVTNPPYSYKPGIGDKFVGQALKFARMHGGTVAMLLNLGALAHRTRTSKWRNDPPSRIHIMDDLVCWPNGDRRQAGRFITEHRYCWIVWTPDRNGPTQLTWLRMAEFREQ